MNINLIFWLPLLIAASFFSCSDQNKCEEIPNTSDINISVSIERIDKQLAEISSKQQLIAFITSNPELKHVFSIEQYPNDSVFFNEFYKVISDPAIDTLFDDVEKVYGNYISRLEAEFTTAFKNIKYYYPSFTVPKVRTIASGFFSPDLYLTDSTIYIALDYFIGQEAHFPPPGEPEYIVKRYRKEYVVPTIIRIISLGMNSLDVQDKSLLAEMIYWGKSYYYVNKILPCTPDSLIIGYSQKQVRVAIANQEKIWAHFVDKQLLYETSHFIKNKYIGDRPSTLEISSRCPGRIGQWLGWKIVNKYMSEQNTDLTLKNLMEKKSATEILSASKFKPKDGKNW